MVLHRLVQRDAGHLERVLAVRSPAFSTQFSRVTASSDPGSVSSCRDVRSFSQPCTPNLLLWKRSCNPFAAAQTTASAFFSAELMARSSGCKSSTQL